MTQTWSVKGQRWLPIGICWLAAGLRLAGLSSRPLWYDEAFAVLFAEKGFGAMLAGTLTQVQGAAADVHPIAYYTGLSGWIQLLGRSPFAVRLLSVFAGVLAVALIYRIGRRLWGRGTAAAGMLIAAGLPFQVYYAQETRMYAALALFCALTIFFYLRAVSGKWLDWLGVAFFAAAAMYMQNLAGIFLLAFGLSALPRPKVFIKVVAAGAVAFLLWLPWFLNLPSQFAKLQQAYWVTTPTVLTLLQTSIIYYSGEELLEARLLLPLALFISLGLPLLLLFQLFKARKSAAGKSALWLTGIAFGAPLLLFGVSLVQPVYIQRALLPAGLLVAPVLGWLLWPPPESAQVNMPLLIRGLLAAALGAVIVAGLTAHYSFAQFPRPNFPEILAYLESHVQARDVVVHSNKLTYLPMQYYNQALPQTFVADPPGSGSDTLALPTQQTLGLYASPDIEAAAGSAQQVWFVIFDRAIEEFAPDPHPHLAWLAAHYQTLNVQQFNDLKVYEFGR